MSLATFQVRESPSGPVRTLVVPDPPPPPAPVPLSVRRMLLRTTLTDAPIVLSGLGLTPLQQNGLTPFELEFLNPTPDRIYSGRCDCQMRLQPGPLGYANPMSDSELVLQCSIDGGATWAAFVSGQQKIFAVGVPLISVDGGSCLVSLSLPQVTGAALGVVIGTPSLRLRASAAMSLNVSPVIEVFSDAGGLGAGGTLALQFTEQNP